MSTVDHMLDGDEPIVQQIAMEEGPLEASLFVSQFNNACRQMAGFEHAYEVLATFKGTWFAPITNMSYEEH